jgi:ribonuclease R
MVCTADPAQAIARLCRRPYCRIVPLRFTFRILDHLSHERYKPSTLKAVAQELRISEEDWKAFEEAAKKLEEEGKLRTGRDGLVRLPTYPDEVIGKFKLNPRGFGFVIPQQQFEGGDLFVPRGSTRDAVSGDLVRAEVIRRERHRAADEKHSPYIARIVEVLERGQEHFVGVLQKRGANWFVEPDGRSLTEPILIRDPHAKNAKVGDKVVIEMLHYPQENYVPEGVITKVLGEAGRPDVETQGVIEAHALRTAFTDDVIEEARRINKAFADRDTSEWGKREDLRDTFVFTIDPPDAKDFDDAISIRHDESTGEWTLSVHIADVSTFVELGGPLDEEAKVRGNSVYLPRLVLPMLPEILSNGICSLQEGVPRLTKTAEVRCDARGNVISQRLASTVIKSAKRLTYIEAQALIDGDREKAKTNARTETPYSDDLIENLRLSDRFARVLRERRMRDGMIVLNLPKVELEFSEEGHVVDAHPEDDSFTHTIIEMFMVEANEAVARTFAGLNVPLIRRIHPEPKHADIEELRMYARAVGEPLPEVPTRMDLQRLLDATRHTPAARVIHFAVLRTLTKATYSPAMIGHYALASEHYTHFTSPIRRYPDLLVHRAIAALLEHTDNGRRVPKGDARTQLARKLMHDDRVLDEGELIELGRHCSETEVEAEAAEYELRTFLVLQYLKEHHLGSEFASVVTGVSAAGVFVSIDRFLVEGLVRMSDLPQGKQRAASWTVNEQTGRLTSRRSGMSLGTGDIVTVRITAIDLAARQMNLEITVMPTEESRLSGMAPSRDGQPKREKEGRGRGKAKAAASQQRKRTARGGKRRR